MSNRESIEFGSTKLTNELNGFFMDQATILREIAYKTNYDRSSIVFPVMAAISDTCKGISLIAQHGLLNEAVMLTRALFERIITSCYLKVCDEEDINKYEAYNKQKAFRKLNREISAGNESVCLKWQGNIDIQKIAGLEESINQYTSKHGREITRWTAHTLEDMIKIIAERSSVETSILLMGVLYFYEDASEALHGTLYGCIFHLGINQPGIKLSGQEDLARHFQMNFTTIFWLGGLALHELILLLNKETNDVLFLDKANESLKSAKNLMKETVGKDL